MKIIIIGAGQVGSALSTNLVREGNDVTLIDTRQDLLEKISEKIDLKAIHGKGIPIYVRNSWCKKRRRVNSSIT